MLLSNLEQKRILITGATGFVGQHLLHALSQSTAKLSCLVRASSNRAALPQSIQVFEADFISGNGLDNALAEQDIVIHLASLLFGLGWQDYLQANVQATDSFGAAIARHKNIKRVVYVSSLAASGPCAISPGVKDNDLAHPVSAYGWSKFMSEQVLHKYCGEKLVVLRPPIIYGSGDKGLLPYFKAAEKGLIITPGYKRKFPVSIIHAHDMASVILCALKPNAHGIYHCNDGVEHSMKSIGMHIAASLQREAKCYGLPLPILGVSAAIMSLGANLLKSFKLRPPSWNLDKFREARMQGWLCHGERISQELGFIPNVNIEQGVQEAIAGYKASGWL